MTGAEENSAEAFDEEAKFRAYRAEKDVSVRDEIFAHYQGVVASVVRGFKGKSEKEDLLQVGYIGLLNAIERFDLDKGFKFRTYATHCIDGEIRHFLRDKTETIRKPRWVRKLSSQIAAYLEVYLQEHERLPSLAEISRELNVAEEGVRAILAAKQPASLDVSGQKGTLLRDSVKSRELVSFQLPVEDRVAISQAFEKLLAMEQKIIYLFFVQDFTQKEIAGKLALSPRKVSRLMQKALGRLRGHLGGTESRNLEESKKNI